MARPLGDLASYFAPMRCTANAILLTLVLAGCSSSGGGTGPQSSQAPKTPTHTAPARVRIAGTMTLTDPSGYDAGGKLYRGASCVGQDGYDDIAAGADVVVADDAGKTLAITHLAGGHLSASFTCVFRFHTSVPAGLGFYGVTVTHRGTIKEPENKLGVVDLTLG